MRSVCGDSTRMPGVSRFSFTAQNPFGAQREPVALALLWGEICCPWAILLCGPRSITNYQHFSPARAGAPPKLTAIPGTKEGGFHYQNEVKNRYKTSFLEFFEIHVFDPPVVRIGSGVENAEKPTLG